GVLGVNLIFAAFEKHGAPAELIGCLMDDLGRERIEIDMIKFSGPAFAGVDNRLLSLQLVEQGLTDAAMFTAAGEVVQPAEVLHKKPVLVERGSFRPPTRLTLDLLERAREQFAQEPGVQGEEPVVLAEMTLRNLLSENTVDHEDFLARADLLGALGFAALISRFQPYYQLADYLAGYTDRPIGLAVGLPSVRQMADERFYSDLPGGVLESMGRIIARDRPHRADPPIRRELFGDSHAGDPGAHSERRSFLGKPGSRAGGGADQDQATLQPPCMMSGLWKKRP